MAEFTILLAISDFYWRFSVFIGDFQFLLAIFSFYWRK
ncbi:hypothetical protein SAMD00020551_0010 [Mesobacillus selenatarsenatis SF-1]|uniref:Uncharacterized protein n=1 Tax=Mesobacillus selenatarsenatis (strain DSM 18680 / JCM 14380 / FERM P-15431 / SF-1) TaxID=1321606 RepID=A0A0A8WWC1_MESS1|nr:hypothetical protein SAMD00020551_0010 [Mesobacillus selenatarsenatis SF-1]